MRALLLLVGEQGYISSFENIFKVFLCKYQNSHISILCWQPPGDSILVTAWLEFGTCFLKFEWFDSTDPTVKNQRTFQFVTKWFHPSVSKLQTYLPNRKASPNHSTHTRKRPRSCPEACRQGPRNAKIYFFLWWSDKSYGRKFKDPCFFFGIMGSEHNMQSLQVAFNFCDNTGCHWIHVLRSSRNQSFKINIWCLCRSFDPNPNNMFEMTINALAEGSENSVVWSCPFSCWPNHPNMKHISPDRVPPPSSKRVILHRLQTRGVTSRGFCCTSRMAEIEFGPLEKNNANAFEIPIGKQRSDRNATRSTNKHIGHRTPMTIVTACWNMVPFLVSLHQPSPGEVFQTTFAQFFLRGRINAIPIKLWRRTHK